MKYATIAKTERFHGHVDSELVFKPGRIASKKKTKYFIIQEREVSYHFYLHQHPYVQQLVQHVRMLV